MFVNQLVTKQHIASLRNYDSNQNLVQMAHSNLIDVMEQNHQKLFEIVKKKIGMQKTVFDKIMASNDLFEWSV